MRRENSSDEPGVSSSSSRVGRNPHQRVNTQNTTPSISVPCISFCIEWAATKRATGSPVAIAHVTGWSSSSNADWMSPRSRTSVVDRLRNGAMSL